MGGSAGNGGSAGGSLGNGGANDSDAGGGPHVVRPCNQLPVAGTWEDITPPGLHGKLYPAGAVVINPKDPTMVYAGSGFGGGLFKSTDCGATWGHINTGKNGAVLDDGRLWDIVIDPLDPQVLYSVNGYGTNGVWKTTNGGVDWENTTPNNSEVGKTANGNFASIISMDPGNHLHLVVAFHSGCSGAYAPSCQAETNDGGTTWRLFKVPGGGEGSGPVVINATTWVFGVYQGLYLTSDSGATWNIAIGQQNCHYQMYTGQDGRYYLGCSGGLITSSGDGRQWSLVPKAGDHLQGLAGDGKSMFAGQQFGSHYFRIPEADPSHFTELPNPDGNNDGGYFMAYDSDHHILYSAEIPNGFWRMVVP
jgi:photosystem II stability/assembly factor-like uncharacterized protein